MKRYDQLIMDEFVITNPHGLDLRCARMMFQTALRFYTAVEISYNNIAANGKNLLDLLALGVSCGGKVNVTLFGSDALQAYRAIAQLFSRTFCPQAASDSQELVVAR